MQTEKAPKFKKDTVYRLKNSIHVNWTRFTTLLSAKIIGETIEPLTSQSRKNAFIIDDTILERSGSTKAELLAKVYDHAKHRYTRGFRMLTLGWSDGVTFLPINTCLLSTENQKNSWFSSPKVIRSMVKQKLAVVAMVKKSSKIHYRFQGEMLSCKEIFSR